VVVVVVVVVVVSRAESVGWDRAQGCSVGWGQGREGSDGAGGKLGFDWG